ncbi:MAG: hypothetical protein IKR41_11630 [Bacteroidales bacterium]|nr:hypothetical protein [Bacteroidales bacterium]
MPIFVNGKSIFKPGAVHSITGKPCIDPAIPGLHPENDKFIDEISAKVRKELEMEGLKPPKKKTNKQ